MFAALIAAAFAAIVAIAVSLPLQSPDDVFFNTGTIAIGVLAAGVLAGMAWRSTRQRPDGILRFVGLCGVMATSVLVLALAGETVLERTFSFVAPLAAIVIGGIALLTPLLDRLLATRPGRPAQAFAAGTVTVALALGLALGGQGDEESGRLELPDVDTASTAPVQAGNSTADPATSGTPGDSGSDGVAAGGFATPADLVGVTFAVGTGSESTFTVTEKLDFLPTENDAVMRSTALSGEIRLDGQPSSVTIDLTTLSSDQSRRDDAVQRMIFNERPTAIFTVDAIQSLPASYAPGDVVTQVVTGTLEFGNLIVPMTFDVEARLDGTVLYVLGRTSFTWDELEIEPPNTPSVTVGDEVRVEILLVAQPTSLDGHSFRSVRPDPGSLALLT